jgi:hypothetical protein
MFGLLLTLWLLSIPVAFLLFDALIHFEFRNYRRNWEKDGKPFSIFNRASALGQPSFAETLEGSAIPYQPKEYDFWSDFRRSSAGRRLMLNWLFMTPAWVRRESKARLLLYAYRFAILFWNVGFFLTLILLDAYYW